MAQFFRKSKWVFGLCATLWLTACQPQPQEQQEIVLDEAGRPTFNKEVFRPQTYPTPHRIPSGGMMGGRPQSPTAGTVKIAVLVPLSGESAKIGNLLLDGATLALFDKYDSLSPKERSTSIVLIPKDTGSTPQQATAAAQEAIDEGAQLMLGPLFAKSVEAVAPLARQQNIPVISFSNDKNVAGNGVYNFGFLPDQQVARIADYVYARGFDHIGALLPNNAYGTMISENLTSIAAGKGRRIEPMQLYAPNQTRMDATVISLTSMPEASQMQALFVAEGEGRLRQIAKTFREQGETTRNVRLIGGGTFDNSEFMRDPYLTGSLFASVTPENYQMFENRFYARYGYKPVKLASLAYDAVALVSTLALSPGRPDFSKETLTAKTGFTGPANGLFRFRSDGTCERGLAVIEITPTGLLVRDNAPDRF